MAELSFNEELDLGIEEIESLEAPGLWEWVAGIGVGAAVGVGVFYLGVAIT